MRTFTLVLALGALAGASPAQAEDASLLGKDAPALQTKEFLQSNGRTSVADYKGEVLFVECFATWCGPCVGQMPHLNKLTEEYGKKGFSIIAVTNEPRETVLKFMTQLNLTPIAYTMGCGGGAENYPARGIPKGFLIGVDGKVIWEGNPGGLPNKLIEQELKKVKITDQMKAAAAEKSLAHAESLIGAKQILSGANLLESIAKQYKGTPSAPKATERLAALSKDEALAKELNAQKTLDKLVGGLEMPQSKFKSKERPAKAAQIESFAKKVKEEAPGTAEMAEFWARVVKEDWKSNH